MTKMTAQHYEFIAKVIREAPVDGITRADMAFVFGKALVGTNPNFDLDRFYMACMIAKRDGAMLERIRNLPMR